MRNPGRFIPLLLLATSPAGATSAENCSTVRLDQGGGSMSRVPSTDQGYDGFCYAVAAGGLFDAYRMQSDPNARPSSAHAVAIDYALVKAMRKDALEVDAGDNERALRMLLDGGSCDRKFYEETFDLAELERNLRALVDLKRNYETLDSEGLGYLKAIERTKDFQVDRTYHGLEQMAGYDARIKSRLAQDIHAANVAHRCHRERIGAALPDPQAIPHLQSAFTDETTEDFIRELKKNICPIPRRTTAALTPRLVVADLTPEAAARRKTNRLFESARTPRENQTAMAEYRQALAAAKGADAPAYRETAMHDFVDEALAKNGLPVAIGYCARHVMASADRHDPPTDCGEHASLIIGRAWDAKSNRCRVLVRNSWGNSSAATYRKGITVEGPNYWVDEAVLYSAPKLRGSTLVKP